MNIRNHITYANVVSTLALCIAVAGGSAWAAGKLNGKELKPKSVSTKAIANNAITAPKLALNSVTKDEIAPNAIGDGQLKALATVTTPSTPGGATALCPSGTFLLSGGARITSGAGPLLASAPSDSGQGWFVNVQAGSSASATAYCLPN